MAIATYCRVSTDEQNLSRQLESTSTYVTDQLGEPLNKLSGYQDISTGTDTERSGYRDLMSAVQIGDISIVVVHEISRLA